MISFKQYLLQEATDTKVGNYVSVAAEPPKFISHLDVTSGSKSKDFHITLVYSKESSVDKTELLDLLNREFKNHGVAKITKADKFDSSEPGKCCIVLKLKAPQLEKINKFLTGIRDIKHSYDKYEPHLTLFYGVDIEEADYWISHINRTIGDEFVHYRGFESTTIIEDWNK